MAALTYSDCGQRLANIWRCFTLKTDMDAEFAVSFIYLALALGWSAVLFEFACVAFATMRFASGIFSWHYRAIS